MHFISYHFSLIIAVQYKQSLALTQNFAMVRKTVKQIIKACDLFCQPAAFRYGDQPQYQSLTGGVCSIALFIIFLVIFTNTVLATFNKVSIDSKTETVQEEDPSFYQVGTDSFMFAVGVTGINLNQGNRWFTVYMEKRVYDSNGKNKFTVPLGQCHKQQWTRIKKQLENVYDKMGFDTWLCPPDGLTIELQGKFSSDVFKHYKIGVKQCSISDPLQATRPCVSNTTIQTWLNTNETFTFNFYFINTIINPSSSTFLSTYLDDLNYLPFTPADGVSANFFLSSYQISTDQSIYPYTQIDEKKGGIATTTAQTINYKVRQKDYLKFYIRKSSLSLTITRSFKKIDETLSYIGGLFSAIVTILFIMNKYNELSYEMQIAKNLYHYDKNVPLKSDQFNFIVYLGYLVYALFETFCIKLPWKRMEVYFRSLEEVRKQMDIRLVMKKILYSERMAIAVFDEAKAKILHLQEPLTLEQAEQIRKDHRFYDKLESKYFDYDKIRQQEEKQHKEDFELQLQIQSKDSQSKSKRSQKTKTKPPIAISDVIIPEDIENKPNKSRKSTKKLLKETYKNNKRKQIEQKTKTNALNMMNLFVDQKQRKEQELQQMISEMKNYVTILQRQAEQGDKISQKILNKFDPKLLKMFLLNQQQKNHQNQMNQQQQTRNAQMVQLSHYTINLMGDTSKYIGSDIENNDIIRKK